MTLYNNYEGDDVEIPSVQINDEEYVKVDNMSDMLLLVQAMGFHDIDDFDTNVEIPAHKLVGKFFLIMGKAVGRFNKQPVFIEGEGDTFQDKLNHGV